MLNQFRRCLTHYTTLSPTEAQCYSLHSCKTTVLSWALQLNVRLDWRAAQGHHKSQVSDSVRKYGRNDILPQLQCQRRVLKKIALGWRPERAVQRGVQGVAEDPSLTQDLLGSATCDSTDSESSEENGAESSSDQSSSQASSDASGLADEEEEELLNDTGPWIVNEASGCCLRAVQCAEHSGRGLQFQGWLGGLPPRSGAEPKLQNSTWWPLYSGFWAVRALRLLPWVVRRLCGPSSHMQLYIGALSSLALAWSSETTGVLAWCIIEIMVWLSFA